MFIGIKTGIPMGGGLPKTTLEQLQALGTLAFYKNYATSQATANADYSVGSATATVTAARSAGAPATYVDSSGNIQLLTTANVLRNCSGYYDINGFISAPGFMSELSSTNTCLDGYFSQTFSTYWRATGTATVSSSSSVTNKYLGGNTGKAVCVAQNDGIITASAKKPSFVNGQTYTVSALVSGTGTAKAFCTPDGMVAQYGTAITLSSSPKLATITMTSNVASGVGNVGVVSDDGFTTLYVHTIQMENAKHHSSFIPTTTASVTRASESLKYEISGNRSSTNETLAVKFAPMYDFNKDILVARFLCDTDTKSRRLYKTNSNAGGSVLFYPNFTDSSTSYAYGYEGVKSGYSHLAIAVSYSPTDTDNSRIFLNGYDNDLNSVDYTEPAWGTYFYIGCDSSSATQANAIIQSIAVYSESLSSSNCSSLSTILAYTPINSIPGYFASNLSAESFLLINQPSAYYSSTANKTFVVYSGTDFGAYAIHYDHTLGSWSSNYLVGTSPAIRDSHGSPAMLLDSSGYIHVTYGTHGGATKYKKSTNPYDISAWTDMASPANLTYPELLQFSDGTIYLFYRNGGAHLSDMGYKTSTDGGNTWSSFNTVVSYTSPSYAYYWFVRKGVGDTIHIGMIWKDEDNSKSAVGDEATHRYNIYYFKYDGTKWVNGNGTDLTSIMPLDHTDLDTAGNNIRLYNSGTVKCQIPVVEVNSSDYPYIFFVEGNLLSYTNKLIYWDGSAWQTKSCTGLNSYNMFSMYALQVNSSSSLTAYITGPSSRVSCGDYTTKFRGGNFEVWDSANTGTTWTRRSVVESLSKELNYPARVINGTSNLRVLFCENTHANTIDFTNKGYGYGDSGIVS